MPTPVASYPSRHCPVCTDAKKTHLFRQTFATLSGGSLLDGFDLVVCQHCGAAYADNIPGQTDFDRYYAEMSKYEYAADVGIATPSDQARFREIVDFLQPHLLVSDRIIDIGCATGGLLAEFKLRGFTSLFGTDPSPSCARIARQLHGLRTQPVTIAQLETLQETFDLALLTGVLEHVREVDESLHRITSRLATTGLLYIEVPDASRYDQHFSAPYQLLSMEHINYFSPVSLVTLLARHGYEPVSVKRVLRQLSPQAIEPCVGGLFRRSDTPAPLLQPDQETRLALERYIAQSAAVENRLHARIDALVAAAVPLAVWGTGTHTLRLLATSRLSAANIVAFIDSNPNYQGKNLVGKPVLSPAAFAGNLADILISSQVAENTIYTTITDSLRWPNRVHRLYAS